MRAVHVLNSVDVQVCMCGGQSKILDLSSTTLHLYFLRPLLSLTETEAY